MLVNLALLLALGGASYRLLLWRTPSPYKITASYDSKLQVPEEIASIEYPLLSHSGSQLAVYGSEKVAYAPLCKSPSKTRTINDVGGCAWAADSLLALRTPESEDWRLYCTSSCRICPAQLPKVPRVFYELHATCDRFQSGIYYDGDGKSWAQVGSARCLIPNLINRPAASSTMAFAMSGWEKIGFYIVTKDAQDFRLAADGLRAYIVPDDSGLFVTWTDKLEVSLYEMTQSNRLLTAWTLDSMSSHDYTVPWMALSDGRLIMLYHENMDGLPDRCRSKYYVNVYKVGASTPYIAALEVAPLYYKSKYAPIASRLVVLDKHTVRVVVAYEMNPDRACSVRTVEIRLA